MQDIVYFNVLHSSNLAGNTLRANTIIDAGSRTIGRGPEVGDFSRDISDY